MASKAGRRAVRQAVIDVIAEKMGMEVDYAVAERLFRQMLVRAKSKTGGKNGGHKR